MIRRIGFIAFVVTAAAGLNSAILAQSAGPQPAPMPPPIVAPRDMGYPGVIRLDVDATDVERRIFKVHETLPVQPGAPLVLLFPQWLPGNHGPTGRVDKLTGLVIRTEGARVAWTRDPVDVFAFHVSVPPQASALDVEFQFASPVETGEGRVMMTPDMLNVQWNAVALYPAGYFARQVTVEPSVRLPDGWHYGTALETASSSGGAVKFTPTSLETLVDSPIFAGRYFARVDLDPGGVVPVHMDVVADKQELLDIKPEQLAAHRALVKQAYSLFGSHHYGHYDFLVALTDHLGGIGLEHHQSSEDGTVPGYFTEWNRHAGERDLLPHEYTHSWNGKFRRPADLWTANFNVPMRDSLLWVYEGQTQYWGYVLAARAGLLTRQEALDAFALTAAQYDRRIGREWRTLADTTNDPIAAQRRAQPWRSWERSEDYYSEGELIWLDADTLIRERSKGRRSLDDFARAFFGVSNGSYVPMTYTFDDVVMALNGVEPYDWARFLRQRLESHGPGAPLDGITRGGYKLVFTDTPTAYFRSAEARRSSTDLTYSLGLVVGREGRITDVMWEGPAFKNALTVGMQIVSVNGITYEPNSLKVAVAAAAKSSTPIECVIKSGDRIRTVRFDYRDGLRYPRLERIAGAPARLDEILAPVP
jgi:predicted metalloprotease with PDZ domain